MKGRQIHLASKVNSRSICMKTYVDAQTLKFFEFKTWFSTKHHNFKESNFGYFIFKCDFSKDPTKVRKKLWNQAWSWIGVFSWNYKLCGKSYQTSWLPSWTIIVSSSKSFFDIVYYFEFLFYYHVWWLSLKIVQ